MLNEREAGAMIKRRRREKEGGEEDGEESSLIPFPVKRRESSSSAIFVRPGSTNVFRSSVYRRFRGRCSHNGTVGFLARRVAPRRDAYLPPPPFNRAGAPVCRCLHAFVYIQMYACGVLRRRMLAALRAPGSTYTCTNAFCRGETS